MAKKYLIGDFLKRIKRPIHLIEDQEYKLVTIKMNHNGVVLREHKKGALIKSNMYKVKKGDFILSGIDARNGAFGIIPEDLDDAIVTNDFWYFEIDEDIISKKLFLELTATTWFDDICKRGSDGTTQRIRLQKNKFFNQSVFLPEGNEQKELLDKILSFKNGQSKLYSEIQTQKQLLTQLKQSILQEAIQGTLTADWRAQRQTQEPPIEPASELLKRIKAEKAQLIKDKKIKKEKPLPPITAEEIPFELPDGWVWCRLGEISSSIQSGLEKSRQFQNESFSNIYFKMNNIGNYSGMEDYSKITRINPTEVEISEYKLDRDDFLFNTRNSRELVGKTCVFKNKRNEIILFNNNLARVKFINISPYYINTWFTSSVCRKIFFDINSSTTNVAAIYLKQLVQLLIPIAPYKEQLQINSKIEILMQKCHALEQEIKTSEANAQMLMQAVLKEAFEGKKEEV